MKTGIAKKKHWSRKLSHTKVLIAEDVGTRRNDLMPSLCAIPVRQRPKSSDNRVIKDSPGIGLKRQSFHIAPVKPSRLALSENFKNLFDVLILLEDIEDDEMSDIWMMFFKTQYLIIALGKIDIIFKHDEGYEINDNETKRQYNVVNNFKKLLVKKIKKMSYINELEKIAIEALVMLKE